MSVSGNHLAVAGAGGKAGTLNNNKQTQGHSVNLDSHLTDVLHEL